MCGWWLYAEMAYCTERETAGEEPTPPAHLARDRLDDSLILPCMPNIPKTDEARFLNSRLNFPHAAL